MGKRENPLRFYKKRFPFLFSVSISKLRYAYGVCSNVPNTEKLHYPLIDCDECENAPRLYDWLRSNCGEGFVFYPSKKGYHAIVFAKLSFPECAKFLTGCPYSDKSHVALGIKRGYWFLESYIPMVGMPVSMMRIERT